MYQSKLVSKTSKEAPKDEISKNAQLLERAGFVQKVLAGVYTYLPLGNRVLQKIENIVREEMDRVGQEVFMPSLQPKESWDKTGRWEAVDVLFKLKSIHGYDYALGPTHEEIVTPSVQAFVSSYRDLPIAVYQIQTKFRDEARAKSGLMRGREFRMKDLYSFHTTQEDLEKYYEEVHQVYNKLFERLGLNAIYTEASGGTFSKYSHEFQVEVETGEDTIYICEQCGLAKNKEVYEGENSECTDCGKTTWRETSAAEVGNIFKLATKFSNAFDFTVRDQNDQAQAVLMGCYGIGTSRVMGVIAELCNDERGLIWPKNIAPFQAHVLPLNSKDQSVQNQIADATGKLVVALENMGMEVLLDDRQESPGAKFADSDLIGIPMRVVISEKTLKENKLEIKERTGEANLMTVEEALAHIKEYYGLRG
jgi:prolyl-tRNA synthetase